MAVHTFYLTDTTATSPGYYGILQDGGTAPTSANCQGLMNIGKLAVGSFAGCMCAGFGASGNSNSTVSTTSFIDSTTGPTAGTALTLNTLGDSFRTPATLSGAFAAGNWTITVGARSTNTNYQGRVRIRVYHSANVDGSSATEVTTATQVGSTGGVMSSTVSASSSITWAAPTFSITNEYLFFQIEWQEQTSAGASNTGKMTLRVGSETSIVTTDLGAGTPTSLVWKPQPFQHMLIR